MAQRHGPLLVERNGDRDYRVNRLWEQKTLQPSTTRSAPRLSPMSSERSVTYVSGPDRLIISAGRSGRI
jgi:hypothetical protein